MNKIIVSGIFSLWASSMCLAQSNQTESLTISTYYPSPYGVYRYLRLSPADEPLGPDRSRGVMYYNSTSNSILYFNNTSQWFDTSAGGGGGGGGFNDAYWNKTASNNIYNNNTDFVGIGNTNPDFPLVVRMSNNDARNATVASFIRRVSGRDQYLNFNLYPPNLWAPYLNSTSVIYVPKDPSGNLEAAALNTTAHIRFNIGGFYVEESEVMRLVNTDPPNPSDPPDPRVGIGTMDPATGIAEPLTTLHVENKLETTAPLMIRGMVGLRKGPIFQIAPYKDRVYLTFGMKVRNGNFYNDPYIRSNGSTNYEGGKICIRPGAGPLGDGYKGVWWFAYDAGGLNAGGRVDDWNVGAERLWDKCGTLTCPVVPPSSRKLKENFSGLDPDDILRKIDRLEVSRWKYKEDGKSVTHIGPIAEDFYRLFKTGSREDELNLIDSVGVSLAGVKALVAQASSQEKRLDELGQEIEDLKAQLSATQ